MESLFWGPPQGSGERKAETRNRGPGKGPGFSHVQRMHRMCVIQPCYNLASLCGRPHFTEGRPRLGELPQL